VGIVGTGYALGIDVGTTFSSAAVVLADGTLELVHLEGRAPSMPSVVLPREDGHVLFGEAAESRAMLDPLRVAREFKRRLGDPTPLVLGGVPYSAQVLTSLLLRHIHDEVTTRMGSAPGSVVVTHPASYSEYRRDALSTAIAEAGIHRATLAIEPEAAAVHYASRSMIVPGEVIAVYDLGGGTFDIALLRHGEDGFELIGTPVGVENLGGSDFDVALLEHVDDLLGGALGDLDASDPASVAALARVRRECRNAKEALSSDLDAVIPVFAPGLNRQVPITRPDFERLIYARIPETVGALRRATEVAGIPIERIDRLVLVGGSSRIPIIRTRVAVETGRPVAQDIDPEHAVALGAARLAADRAARAAALIGAAALGVAEAGAATPARPATASSATTATTVADHRSSRTAGDTARRRRPFAIAAAVLALGGAGATAGILISRQGSSDASGAATTTVAGAEGSPSVADAATASTAPAASDSVPDTSTSAPTTSLAEVTSTSASTATTTSLASTTSAGPAVITTATTTPGKTATTVRPTATTAKPTVAPDTTQPPATTAAPPVVETTADTRPIVPDVHDKVTSEAAAAINGVGLTMRRVEPPPCDATTQLKAVDQEPPAFKRVDPHSEVVVTFACKP
jgi:actin-like ATPase involved in cell morphogenesis